MERITVMKPMYHRTISFRYTRSRGEGWYHKHLEAFAADRNLRLTSTKRIWCPGFNSRDLIAGWRDLFPNSAMPTEHYLSEKRKTRLARKVSISVSEYADISGSLRLCVETAESNCVPFMGSDLWFARRLVLPAGFVTLEGPDSRRSKATGQDLYKLLL